MDKIFKALADSNRRKIINLLIKEEMTVSELLKNFAINQATLSNHLAILKKANLVGVNIRGRWHVYFLNRAILSTFVYKLNDFIGVKVNQEYSEIVPRGKQIILK